MSLSPPDHQPPALPTPAEPAAEIDEVLRSMMDRLFVLVATLGVLAFALSTVRVATRGYNQSYLGDAASLLVVLGVLALRRRLPIRVVFGVVVGVVVLLGLVSLATLGLASAGMMILTAACVLVGVFASLRTAVGVTVGVFALVVLIGVLQTLAVLQLPPDVAAFIAAPASWGTQAATFLAYVVAVLFATAGVRQRLTRSLEDLRQRSSELAQVAERLRESESRHRLLADNITDVVFVQALDLSVQYMSQSAEQLFGRSVDELRRLGMPGILTPESLRRAQEVYQTYLASAARGEPVEPPLLAFEYVRADGSTFWGELKVRFLRDANGTLQGSQGVLRDISERRRAEQERLALEERLREAEKLQAIGQLAGGVAHDFNNQLSAIMGFAELVQLDANASADVRGHAGNIMLAARRSADLTGKLLAFARRKRQASTAVELHVVIGEVVAMLERTVDRNIHIETRLEASRSVVLGDASQLASALLNLGLNARDAMPRGGRLVFATASVTDQSAEATTAELLELRVTDTGSGMDPETIRHAFEPFFTRKDLGKGTGLGLAAVYGTVKSHGGSIDIESSPGVGTTFCLRFPLHDAMPQGTSASSETVFEPVRRSVTTMVVDDEELVGRATCLALQRAGHRARCFTDPREALHHYRESWREIDVVIIDMIMPGMTGQELFNELRAIHPDVAAVLTSGHVPPSAVQELVALGAREFLAKPFTASELAGAVDRVVGTAPAR